MQDEARFTELLAGVRETNQLLYDVRKYLCGLNVGAAVMLVLFVLKIVKVF